MSTDWTLVLIVVRVVLLWVGIATTGIAFRAYRRQRTRYLKHATIGFGLMTLGVLIEGMLYQVTPLSLIQVHIVESVAIGFGFVTLLYSFLQ
ncbi:MAG: hypothetical protein ABEI06_08795 [Halobacteriaceae archaeon]